jgi:hypothetical protein
MAPGGSHGTPLGRLGTRDRCGTARTGSPGKRSLHGMEQVRPCEARSHRGRERSASGQASATSRGRTSRSVPLRRRRSTAMRHIPRSRARQPSTSRTTDSKHTRRAHPLRSVAHRSRRHRRASRSSRTAGCRPTGRSSRAAPELPAAEPAVRVAPVAGPAGCQLALAPCPVRMRRRGCRTASAPSEPAQEPRPTSRRRTLPIWRGFSSLTLATYPAFPMPTVTARHGTYLASRPGRQWNGSERCAHPIGLGTSSTGE